MVRTTRSHTLRYAGVRLATLASAAAVLVSSATVAGLAAPSSAPVVAQSPAASQVLVKDPENRFTIMVPANWAVQTSTSARAPAVTAKSPVAGGQLPDSVDVITQDLPTPINAQECGDKIAQVMRFTIHRWTTLHEGAATFLGMPAYSRAYTWRTNAGQERRSDQTCVTMGRRAFVVIGTTANDQRAVQQELPQLQRIIATFHPNTINLPPSDHPGVPGVKAPGEH
jgi:hypothetical protein